MKFGEETFPKGTFKKQLTDGAYLDKTLSQNLDIYAKKIADDMHFLILITGNDSVGNGKSTLASHLGSYLTLKINELHKTNNTFTSKNISFNSEELEKKSFQHNPYSVLVLDEGDDLVSNWMKETAQNLKRYFRKCRQLNQILILILPSFFELPKFYALARSHCLLNVKFLGNFDRGFFDFYGPKSKKLLYLKGKKEWNYSAYNKDFHGRFFSEYCFFPDTQSEAKKYRDRKHSDMMNDADRKKPLTEAQLKGKMFSQVYKNLGDISIKRLAEGFGVSERTGNRWLSVDYNTIEPPVTHDTDIPNKLINNPMKRDDDDG